MKEKTKAQKRALKKWKKHEHKATIMAATGVGKTYIGVRAAKYAVRKLGVQKILIVVPTTNLRDNEWPNEFKKWGCESLLKYVDIQCIQSVYKDPPLADFLIVDEIHTVLSTKYSNVFSRNYSYILGLTATVSENKLELLEQYAPICFKLGLVEAQEKGLINSFNIYNVSVPLNPKERYMYKMYDGQFREASGILGSYNRAWNTGMNSFSAAQKFKEDSFHEMYKWAKQFWFTMTKRKQICQLANSKIEAAIKIIEKYPEKKWIIFSKSINFTQKVHTILTEKGIVTSIYHSNLSKKKQKENLELSHKKKCRVICSAEALNTGFDLPDLDAAIVLSGDSSEITAIQQIGRTARYRERKPISLFVNLYAVNTREEVWIRNKYSSLEESKYHFVTLNSFLHGGSTI